MGGADFCKSLVFRTGLTAPKVGGNLTDRAGGTSL